MNDAMQTDASIAGPPTGARDARGLDPYDAILLISFGGPERPEDVMPFMHRVTGGRVPQERLVEVAQHYYARDGRSPINDESRALVAAMSAELGRRGVDTPIIWGNRHFAPYVTDALAEAGDRGLHRLLVVVTSAFSSYSGCRVYREELAAGLAETGLADRLELDLIRPFGSTPAFRVPMARLTREAVQALAQEHGIGTERIAQEILIMFVTHSIPDSMAHASGPPDEPNGYVTGQLAACAWVVQDLAEHFGAAPAWELTYCSRSGSPKDPWLEPDVSDALAQAAARGVRQVVVVPIGFVSDHMEVVYDLDEEAAQTAAELGLNFARVSTVRDDVQFVSGLVDLVFDRAAQESGRQPSRRSGQLSSRCPAGCCANAARPGIPAIAEESPGQGERASAERLQG
ncbi:MAG: ferrochelatase [Micrococcales bacterium]|nr:ferrochelatase [Micrococcales bacterium]